MGFPAELSNQFGNPLVIKLAIILELSRAIK